MYDSVRRVQGERSLADALLREPHYLSRRKHQTTGGKTWQIPSTRLLPVSFRKNDESSLPISKQHSMPSARESSPTGTLPAKTKQVIAVAVAHVTQCPYCIKGHTKAALGYGATPELMEAIWVAAEMRAGGAYAHSAVSLVAMDETADRAPSG